MRQHPFALLALLALVARILVLALLPGDAISIDLARFETVFLELQAGRNPYVTTSYVNYAPLWIQLLWLLGHAADLLHLPLLLLIRLFLIGSELILLRLVWNGASEEISSTIKGKVLLWGWCVNPLPILLTVQHAHFDVLVAICCLLFFIWCIKFNESRESVDWLFSCLWLGAGIALKTVPLVLVPLALSGFRIVKLLHTRVLSGVLLFGLTALPLGAVFILAPRDISDKVLLYTSVPGYFGITGVLSMAGFSQLISLYRELFFLLLMVNLCVFTATLSKSDQFGYSSILSFILFQFCFLIAFGPGYGPQYLFWIFPFVILRLMRRASEGENLFFSPYTVFLLIAAVTSLIEYGCIDSLGSFLSGVEATREFSQSLTSRDSQTVLRLPLFMVLLWIFYIEGKSVLRLPAVLMRGSSHGNS